jgi:dephospho-CoA kinase
VYRIGLTGGIGSGKSEVAAALRELGATIVAADSIAREIVGVGTPALARIAEAFGSGVLGEDGTLDRRKLAGIVFADRDRLSVLNGIVRRPLVEAILSEIEDLERTHQDGVVVVDAALLLDWDISDAFDLIVAVLAPLDRRLNRLAADGLTASEAVARMGVQPSDERFAQAADVVIDNDGTLAELRERVAGLWASLQQRSDREEP